MARAKTKSSSKIRLLVYLTAAVVVLIGGFVLYNKHATANNKKNFQDARSTIDNIYYDAVKQIGPADNAQLSSNCSKTYKEFSGYGNLACHVDIAFIYPVSSGDEANSILEKIQSNIKKKYPSLKTVGNLSGSIRDSSTVNTAYHTTSDTYELEGLKCTANYVFDTPSETSLAIKDSSKKPFEITIGCWGPAKQQYYRLAS